MGIAEAESSSDTLEGEGVDDGQKRIRGRKKSTKSHPDHSKQVVAVNRVIGQLEKIKKMMLAQKYCPDIIHQVRAARGGLASVEASVLGVHILNCLHDAIFSGHDAEIDAKTSEIVKYVRSLIV